MPVMSVQEERFASQLAKHGDSIRAAREAGFEPKNERGLRLAAAALLTKPHIREFIAAEVAALVNSAKIRAAKVVQGLSRIAFADRTEIFREDCSLRPISEWSEESKAIVAGIERTVGMRGGVKVETVKVRFQKRTPALVLLARFAEMTTRIRSDRVPHTEPPESCGPILGGSSEPDSLGGITISDTAAKIRLLDRPEKEPARSAKWGNRNVCRLTRRNRDGMGEHQERPLLPPVPQDQRPRRQRASRRRGVR